jgi:hypothetical protein
MKMICIILFALFITTFVSAQSKSGKWARAISGNSSIELHIATYMADTSIKKGDVLWKKTSFFLVDGERRDEEEEFFPGTKFQINPKNSVDASKILVSQNGKIYKYHVVYTKWYVKKIFWK